MAHDEQDDRLDGLKSHERPACLIAERVLGVVAHANDRPGAGPRRVDAILHYPDGRRAAFEVLRLAERADLHPDLQR